MDATSGLARAQERTRAAGFRVQLRTIAILGLLPMIAVIFSDAFPSVSGVALLRIPAFVMASVVVGAFVKRLDISPAYTWSFVLLAGFSVVSILWSDEPDISLSRAALNVAFGLGLVFYASSFSSNAQAAILRGYLLPAAFATLTISAYGYFSLGSEAYFMGNFRGGLANSNGLAHFMCVLTAPVLLVEMQRSKRFRFLALMCLLAALFFLALTRSRAALFAVAIGLVAFVLTGRSETKRTLLLSASAGAFLVFLPDIFNLLSSKYGDGGGVFGTRASLWALNIETTLERPFLGYGIGINPVDYKGIANYMRDTEKGSSLITLPQELGIPFFLIYLSVLLTATLRPVKEAWRRLRHGSIGAAYRLPLVVIVVSLVHCLFESWLFSFGNIAAIAFWMSVGCLVRLEAERRDQRHPQGARQKVRR